MKVEAWDGKETISISDAIRVLNRALKSDKNAVRDLIASRVDCNKKLAGDSTIQVAEYDNDGNPTPGQYRVGMLGFLNGLFGLDRNGFGPISADIDDNGDVKRFLLTDTEAVTKNIEKAAKKKK